MKTEPYNKKALTEDASEILEWILENNTLGQIFKDDVQNEFSDWDDSEMLWAEMIGKEYIDFDMVESNGYYSFTYTLKNPFLKVN